MTGKKLLLFSLLQAVGFIFLKVWFLNNQLFSSSGIQTAVFWLLTAAVAAALVRRFGFINYLESIFVIIFWTGLDLLLDLAITTSFAGLSIFASLQYWGSLLAMDISIFLFHKKRHIEIRREHASHGHH